MSERDTILWRDVVIATFARSRDTCAHCPGPATVIVVLQNVRDDGAGGTDVFHVCTACADAAMEDLESAGAEEIGPGILVNKERTARQLSLLDEQRDKIDAALGVPDEPVRH